MRDLLHFFDDNSSFSDNSLDLNNYLQDDVSLSWVALEDAQYIGLYKPFYNLYFELTTAASASPSLSIEYWNGSAWSALSVRDETKDLSRSGFIRWDRELTDWAATTVNSESAYYIRLTASVDFTVTYRGINIVFANDNDLTAEQADVVTRYKASGDSSMIRYHVAARNEIIQSLRNSGYLTQQTLSENPNQITQWDLLDIDEPRQAAKFLALSKIWFDVSNETDDKSWQKYKENYSHFGSAYKLFFQSLDSDDDGVQDQSEKMKMRTLRILKT